MCHDVSSATAQEKKPFSRRSVHGSGAWLKAQWRSLRGHPDRPRRPRKRGASQSGEQARDDHRSNARAVAAKRLLVAARKLFSHRGRTVTIKEREAVGGTERKEDGYPSFSNFVVECEHLVPFWNERFPSFQTCRCVCVFLFRRSKGGWTAFRMGACHGWKERFPLFFCCFASIFQVADAPALVRCQCRCGATSPAS